MATPINLSSDKISNDKVREIESFDDNTLWRMFRDGDRRAFNLIYKKYIQALYNFGKNFSRSEDVVEDCIHDLFIDLWKNRSNLNDTVSLKFYLLKGLKRKLVKVLKINKNSNSISDDYAFELTFSHESYLINELTTSEQKLKLSTALTQLTVRQKEAIFLRFYEELSYQEISSLMSISLKTVYNLVHTGVVDLRKKLLCLLIILTSIFTL